MAAAGTRELTRSGFLRAGAAFAVAGPHRFTRRELKHELRIMQWAHPTPGYDSWLALHARRWGEANDTAVTIDNVNSTELPLRARAEAATRHGHDLVQLLAPPTAFQLDAAPLDDAVAEVRRRRGAPAPVATASAYNPRTRRWFAFPDHYVRLAAVWRTDLWHAAPSSWPAILAAAPALRRRGHPVAVGLSGELDSNTANLSLLLAHGGRIDRLAAAPTLEYLRTIAELYRRGMPREVIQWNPASNNQFLLAGRGSLIANPVSVLAAARRNGAPVAERLRATPLPVRSVPHTIGCYVLWRFSRNRDAAERWLVDQQLGYGEHVVRSGHLNVPAWSDARDVVGAGYPGPTNGAVQELVDSLLVPTMARRVAQGKTTAANAAADAARQAAAVFARWREAKLI